jgi:hypothetical protein
MTDHFRSLLLLFIVALLASRSVESADHWSNCRATDDPGIQWRSRVTEFNRNISPVCEFEFNHPLAGSVSFAYEVHYDAVAAATGQRKGRAYNTSNAEHGGQRDLWMQGTLGASGPAYGKVLPWACNCCFKKSRAVCSSRLTVRSLM